MKFTTTAAAAAILSLFLASTASAAKSVRGLQTATYRPGDFSDGNIVEVNGHQVFLANGLKARPLALYGQAVVSDDGSTLASLYHAGSDGGECIPKTDGSGGYYYVSNSEMGKYPDEYVATAARKDYSDLLIGGVYSLEFNADHELIGYKKVLANTALNCHGGKTPWNTWISCEEHRQWGRCWQVDPTGEIDPQPTALTPHGIEDYGNWEAFAWDGEYGYVTDDDYPKEGSATFKGALVRFTPDDTAKACLSASTDAGKWCALNSGTHEFLKLSPDTKSFEWVSNKADANPELYQGSEGIHIQDGVLTFVTVVDKLIFRLDLDMMTYTSKNLPFPQEPDNIRQLGDTMYLCTDGDHEPNDGVWGWDANGAYKVLYEENHNYPAGVSFSPDGTRMYVSFWGEATWQIWREDGLRFDDETAGVSYEHGVGLDE